MSAEQQKAAAFISRLLANPALGSLTPLQREEQIIQFLHANAAQLSPTLGSASFFPGLAWYQIVALLLEALRNEVDKTFLPSLDELLSNVQLSFVTLLRQQAAGSDKVRAQMKGVLHELSKRMEARRVMTGPLAALQFKVIPRYIDQVWMRRSYIHRELTRVQRLQLGKEEVNAMIETTLLLKPVITLVSSGDGTRASDQLTGVIQNQYAEKVFAAAKRHLPLFPDELISSCVNANISYVDNRFDEATSRMAAIFAARCRNYQPGQRVDRGADTPDKSWLSIARRNYKFYGFDIKMLDELYSIAAENGW
jgi:hypothetical protein